MKSDPTLTAERLRELLAYDPDTGEFRWIIRPTPRIRPGSLAGCVTRKGYLYIRYEDRGYMAHRLAWLYVYGEWPKERLDHRNGVKLDNRIDNLRAATNAENNQNHSRPNRNNRSGFLGVSRNRAGWQAAIKVDHTRHHLGTFGSPEEAAAAYIRAKHHFHPFWEGHLSSPT